MRLYDLRTEYLRDPLGLDENHPHFSWKLASEQKDTIQNSYRIVVRDGASVAWDSGLQMSDTSICVAYDGTPLCPRTIYAVAVTVSDNYGNTAVIDGKFETGLRGEGNFPGEWITHTLDAEDTAVPYFERKFSAGRIKRARLYATACGVYDAALNGKRISDTYFAPGWTAYHSRMLYQTYDVTKLISENNVLSVAVGNGWYKGIIGFAYRPDFYGNRTALKLALCLQYDDREEWIVTDENWNVYTGLIRESELYNGEVQNLAAEKKYCGNAVLFSADTVGKIEAQTHEPVRIIDRLCAKEKIITPKGEIVFDFGQNLTGFVRVNLPKNRDGKLVIRHAETLDRDGNFYTENLRRAKATDTYIYSDEQIGQAAQPYFTFHGFRYIAVEGACADLSPDNFTACVLSSDTEKTGSFSCNLPLVNRLQSNIAWSEIDNFLDIPTDCPQRDERLGWTGDAQVFSRTAAYNRNVAAFFRKWLRDVDAEQTDEYGPAHVVPNVLGDIEAGAAWCDSVTFIPWNLYQIYGDKRFLSKQYRSMTRYVEYIARHSEKNLLWQKGLQYGDWLALDGEPGSPRGATDQYYAANAFYLRSLEIVRDSAYILGYETDAKKYAERYDAVKAAFQHEYFTRTGRIVSETQTGCILPLQFGLIKPEEISHTVDLLEDNICNHKMHLNTGFMGTPYICQVLSDNGRHDIATHLFLAEDCPSWLYAVKHGATTIWERWDSILPDGSFNANGMNSLNHYANGSIGDWMYNTIAGINAAEPGYKKIRIAPKLTKGIDTVCASLETVYGLVSIKYCCKAGNFTADIEIPCNTTAVLQLPERKEPILTGSGKYHFEYPVAAELAPVKYSMYSLVGDVLTQDAAKEILDREAPEAAHSPILGVLWEMPLFKLKSVMPEGSETVLKEIVDTLNRTE